MSTDVLERPPEAAEEISEMDAAEIADQTEEQTADSPAEPAPSLEELKRRHYYEIAELGRRCDLAFDDYLSSKQQTADAKKLSEGQNAALLRLIRRGPELQRELPLGDGDAPLSVDDSWRKLPVTELGLSDHLVGALAAGRIETLGDLQDHWQAGKHVRELRGIGEASDAAVVDAFSTYGAEHPEVFGQQPPAAGAVEDDEGDEDDDSDEGSEGIDGT